MALSKTFSAHACYNETEIKIIFYGVCTRHDCVPPAPLVNIAGASTWPAVTLCVIGNCSEVVLSTPQLMYLIQHDVKPSLTAVIAQILKISF